MEEGPITRQTCASWGESCLTHSRRINNFRRDRVACEIKCKGACMANESVDPESYSPSTRPNLYEPVGYCSIYIAWLVIVNPGAPLQARGPKAADLHKRSPPHAAIDCRLHWYPYWRPRRRAVKNATIFRPHGMRHHCFCPTTTAGQRTVRSITVADPASAVDSVDMAGAATT